MWESNRINITCCNWYKRDERRVWIRVNRIQVGSGEWRWRPVMGHPIKKDTWHGVRINGGIESLTPTLIQFDASDVLLFSIFSPIWRPITPPPPPLASPQTTPLPPRPPPPLLSSFNRSWYNFKNFYNGTSCFHSPRISFELRCWSLGVRFLLPSAVTRTIIFFQKRKTSEDLFLKLRFTK